MNEYHWKKGLPTVMLCLNMYVSIISNHTHMSHFPGDSYFSAKKHTKQPPPSNPVKLVHHSQDPLKKQALYVTIPVLYLYQLELGHPPPHSRAWASLWATCICWKLSNNAVMLSPMTAFSGAAVSCSLPLAKACQGSKHGYIRILIQVIEVNKAIYVSQHRYIKYNTLLAIN